MSIKRITISVPKTVANRVKKAAAATGVSAWVTSLIEERLDDAELERQWLDFYQAVGPSRQDVRRAEGLLKRLTHSKRRRHAA